MSSHERETVGLVNRSLQLFVRADWDPKRADDDRDKPQPKGTDSLAVRVDAVPHVHEGVDSGEDEGDDDPCYGSCCGGGPGVGLFESVDKTFPPVVVLGKDYKGREESLTDGQPEWKLLEVDEGLGGIPAVS